LANVAKEDDEVMAALDAITSILVETLVEHMARNEVRYKRKWDEVACSAGNQQRKN
jgi:hypothetical protein